jgi:hypothetical protein
MLLHVDESFSADSTAWAKSFGLASFADSQIAQSSKETLVLPVPVFAPPFKLNFRFLL